MGDCPARGRSAVHRHWTSALPFVVEQALQKTHALGQRDHTRLLPVCDCRRYHHRHPHRSRILQFHRAHRFALRRLRRHPHPSRPRSHALRSMSCFCSSEPCLQMFWDHWRRHAFDPPMAAHEPTSRRRSSRRLFHFHRLECRRLPHTDRRSAAFSRLSERRAVLVGGREMLAHLAARNRFSPRSLLRRSTAAITRMRQPAKPTEPKLPHESPRGVSKA